jgi:hypothetical protein
MGASFISKVQPKYRLATPFTGIAQNLGSRLAAFVLARKIAAFRSVA